MKKILTATALSAALLVGLTACSGENPATIDRPNAPKSSQTATPKPVNDKQAVTTAYTGFLDQLYKTDNTELQTTLKDSVKNETSLTDEVKAKVVKTLEEKYPFLKKINTAGMTPDQIGPTYGTFLQLGAAANEAKAKIDVEIPADAVEVSGDKATIDMSKATIKLNGEKSANAMGEKVKFSKVNGEWLIEPDTAN